MINDKTDGRLAETKEFASRAGKLDNLEDRLAYLGNYACNDGRQTRCDLYRDYDAGSFFFRMHLKQAAQDDSCYKEWFVGGLIFHGSHDGFGSGAAPTFSVCLTPEDGWSVHT